MVVVVAVTPNAMSVGSIRTAITPAGDRERRRVLGDERGTRAERAAESARADPIRELLNDRDRVVADRADELLLDPSLERLDLRRRIVMQRVSGGVSGALDVPERLNGIRRVERVNRLLHILGLGTEQAERDLALLRGVLDAAQLVEDLVERLCCFRSALLKDLLHLVGVETEILIGSRCRLAHSLSHQGEFLEAVGDDIGVAGTALESLLQQPHRRLSVETELPEFSWVLVERVEQVLGGADAVLRPLDEYVEGFLGILGEARFQHRADGATDVRDVLAHDRCGARYLRRKGFDLPLRRLGWQQAVSGDALDDLCAVGDRFDDRAGCRDRPRLCRTSWRPGRSLRAVPVAVRGSWIVRGPRRLRP